MYVGFGITCDFRNPPGVLGCIPRAYRETAKLCLDVFFLVFILLEAHSASRTCSLMSFISMGKFSSLFSSDTLDARSLSAVHLELRLKMS